MSDFNKENALKKTITILGLLVCMLAGIILLVANGGEAGASAPSCQLKGLAGAGGQATSVPKPGIEVLDSCSTIWHTVPSPNGGSSYNHLEDIAIYNSSNIWAVGYYSNAGVDNTL